MEKQSKFYTQLHHELLKLVEYHKKVIHENHSAGIIDNDDTARLNMLNRIPELIVMNIRSNEDYARRKQEEKEKLLLLRQQADCPECKAKQQVKIIKQTTNKKFGWKLDVVKCKKCKTVFTNYMPNNWSDRVKFSENLYYKLFEIREDDDKTLAEILEIKGVAYQKEYKIFLDFKKAQKEVERADKGQVEALKKAEEALVVIRDFLLTAKIKRQNWNIPDYLN